MTLTFTRAAKVANARRAAADHLTGPDADHTARQIVDALLALGWRPSGWDDEPPPPASSDRAHRARVIAEAKAAIDSKRRQRTTVRTEET